MSEWKETEVGRLPHDWNIVTINELLDVKGISVGVMYPGEDTVGGTPMIRVGDIKGGKILSENLYRISESVNNLHKRTILQGGELLVTLVGNPGTTVVVTSEFQGWNAARAIGVLKLKDPTDAIYLSYSLSTLYSKYQIDSFLNTTVQPTLNLGELKMLQIPWPIKAIRNAIAEVLNSLDEKIHLLNRQNKTLEELAETLFRQWFMESSLSKEMMMGEIAKITSGKSLNRSEFFENGCYPIYGSNGVIGWTNSYFSEEKIIITGRVGTLGTIKIVDEKCWISDNVLIIKPKSDLYTYPIYFSMKGYDFESLNVGSTQPLLTQNELNKQSVTLLDEHKLLVTKNHFDILFTKINLNTKQIKQLETIRDTLLPKLMSGAVRVLKT